MCRTIRPAVVPVWVPGGAAKQRRADVHRADE